MADNSKPRMPKAKQKILEIMFFLLQTKDFDDITVDEICHISQLSRSTFYRYFEDKYDVVLQYIKDIQVQPHVTFTEEAWRQYLDTFLTTDYTLNHILIRLISDKGNKELQSKIYTAYKERYTEFYKEKTACNAKPEDMAKMMSEYTCSGIIHLISWWIDKKYPISKKTLAQFILHMIEAPILFPASIITKE